MECSQLTQIKKMDLRKFDEYDRANCLGEAQRLKALRSKYIIGFRDVFQIDEILFLIMDYASGGSLHLIIKTNIEILTEKRIWEYLRQICLGIKCCHDNKIIHRDIKPVNILIHKGVLKLCDFGISKQLETGGNANTNTWSNIDYMSPEMLLGHSYSYP